MGYPMAGHMATVGHSVTVYNRSSAKAEAWLAEISRRGGADAHAWILTRGSGARPPWEGLLAALLPALRACRLSLVDGLTPRL